jgi:PPOX class probable F420-dependent enzyme
MTNLTEPDQARYLELPESAQRLIESGKLAHVVTLNPDGSPHVTGVWIGLDDGDIVFASMFDYRKTKNLRRDPRVAISVESAEFHGSGLREYLVVRGRAEVTEGGAFDMIRLLANVYIAPGAEMPPPELAVHAGYVTRVKVEEIGGVGPWAGDPPKLSSK